MVAVHMTTPATKPNYFRVGTVLAGAAKIFLKNILYMFFVFLVTLLVVWAADETLTPYATGSVVDTAISQAVLAVSLLVGFIAYVIGASLVVHAAFQYLREGRPRIIDMLARGLARAPMLIVMGGLVLIVTMLVFAIFAVILGVIMFNLWPIANVSPDGLPVEVEFRLVVVGVLAALPALFPIVIWYVSGAAFADEELGPVQALKRSRKLSKGVRWRLLALVLISACISSIPDVVGVFAMQLVGKLPWPALLAWVAFAALFHAYIWVIPCAAFVELRQAKEGKDIRKISDVFD